MRVSVWKQAEREQENSLEYRFEKRNVTWKEIEKQRKKYKNSRRKMWARWSSFYIPKTCGREKCELSRSQSWTFSVIVPFSFPTQIGFVFKKKKLFPFIWKKNEKFFLQNFKGKTRTRNWVFSVTNREMISFRIEMNNRIRYRDRNWLSFFFIPLCLFW